MKADYWYKYWCGRHSKWCSCLLAVCTEPLVCRGRCLASSLYLSSQVSVPGLWTRGGGGPTGGALTPDYLSAASQESSSVVSSLPRQSLWHIKFVSANGAGNHNLIQHGPEPERGRERGEGESVQSWWLYYSKAWRDNVNVARAHVNNYECDLSDYVWAAVVIIVKVSGVICLKTGKRGERKRGQVNYLFYKVLRCRVSSSNSVEMGH